MQIKIINEKENPLFKRKEIEAEANEEITPSQAKVIEIISEKFSAKPEAIEVRGIYGKFGTKTFKIFANIYESEKDKEETEIKKKKSKKQENKGAEKSK